MERSGPAKKAIIGWTAGMFTVLGMVWFIMVIVLPLWHVRRAVVEYGPSHSWDDQTTDWVVAAEKAAALRELGEPEQTARWLGLYLHLPNSIAPRKERAVGMLGSCGRTAVPLLISAAKEPEFEIRASAIFSLGRIGPEAEEAVPVLVDALKDRNCRIVETAARALVRIDQPSSRVVTALASAAERDVENIELLYIVCRALRRWGAQAKEAIPTLERIQKMKGVDWEITTLASQTLEDIQAGIERQHAANGNR